MLTQETIVATLEASLAPLQKNLSQTRHALSMLVGELPSEDCLPIFSLDHLHLPGDLPISLPSRLVDQRPDVQASSALLHVQADFACACPTTMQGRRDLFQKWLCAAASEWPATPEGTRSPG